MSLGDGSFFELIAIDPEGPKPAQPRWYSLDDPATKERLIKRPRALTWVVNTDDLDSVVAHSPVDLGEIIPVQRGDLTWRLTVPKDGHLAGEGLIPAFIEWDQKPPPGTFVCKRPKGSLFWIKDARFVRYGPKGTTIFPKKKRLAL